MTERHSEIDLLRTIAIVMMVIYHIGFDLAMFYNWSIDLSSTFWESLRVCTVLLFLIISGISSHFSSHLLKRGLIVLGCAGLISVATYLFDPTTFIRFGILHCIGTGMLLLIIFKQLKEYTIPLGLLVLITPTQIPPPHIAVDYYPIVPWFGVMLIGAGIGHFLYIRNSLALSLTLPQILLIPGRNALIIYLVHQPIILSLLQAYHTLS